MARKSTIKLLLINESDNEGERLISLFRNAGRVARAQRANSLEELHKLLEAQKWDLLLADDKHPEVSIEQALEQLKKSSVTLSAIAISDSDPIPLLEAGASDVIASSDDNRLVLAALRELRHMEYYRELEDVREKLNDAEERSALLMAQSQDAIAYVADGMLVSCNALFATRFGYDEPDDLDCAAVIDLIDSGDHDKFKSLLKAQLSSDEGSTHFSFTGIKHGNGTFAADMQLSNAVYDDEPCVQLSVRDPGGAATGDGGGSPNIDYLTDLYSAPYLASQVDAVAKQASAGANTGALLFILIDQFAKLRSRLGIIRSAELINNLAQCLKDECPGNACLARYCDDGFGMLLEGADIEEAKTTAQVLRQAIKQHSASLGDGAPPCDARIGIAGIDSQQEQNAETIIGNAFTAANSAGADNSDIAVFVPVREKKSLGDASSDAELDKILEEVLEEGQCFLIFQPVVSLRGTAGDHYEVQTHLTDANENEVAADEFLSSLNFSGINTRLDRWIILEATKQLAEQVQAGYDTRLFINLTSNSLRDESLIAWLGVALKAGGIPAQALAFQFQEAEVLKYQQEAQSFAAAIRKLGCKIAIANAGNDDDAGNILGKIKPDFTKIADQHTQALLKSGDADTLKAQVANIAERESQSIISGVENAAALAQLWQLGVDFIQGAYLAGPSRHMDYEFTDIA